MTHHAVQQVANVVPLVDVAEWALKAVFSLMFGTLVKIAWNVGESVKILNIKMALVVDHITDHDKKIDKHESRLDRLERAKSK